MSLRVTQQYVEVLASGDSGKMRVTQQYLEVLGDHAPINLTADSAINLTQTLVVRQFVSQSLTSTIALDHSAQPSFYRKTATDVISLAQSAGVQRVIERAADSTIELTSSSAASGPIDLSADTVIDLSQQPHVGQLYVLDATDLIEVTDSAGQGGTIRRSVANELELTQLVNYTGELARQLESDVALTDGIDLHFVKQVSSASAIDLQNQIQVSKVLNLQLRSPLFETTTVFDPVTQTIVTTSIEISSEADFAVDRNRSSQTFLQTTHLVHLQHIKSDAVDLAASNELDLDQDLRTHPSTDAISILSLGHFATGVLGTPTGNDLTIEHLVGLEVVYGNRSATTELEVQQSVTFELISGNTLCQYSPFVGDSSDPDAPQPPPSQLAVPQGLPEGVRFRLFYPHTGEITDHVDLRAPNFGNRERLQFNRINRETRGGTLIVFADPIWPKLRTLVLSFSGLTHEQADQLKIFMAAHLGHRIGMIDWEGYRWAGIITTPNDPIVEDSRNRFTASFEFLGEPIEA